MSTFFVVFTKELRIIKNLKKISFLQGQFIIMYQSLTSLVN